MCLHDKGMPACVSVCLHVYLCACLFVCYSHEGVRKCNGQLPHFDTVYDSVGRRPRMNRSQKKISVRAGRTPRKWTPNTLCWGAVNAHQHSVLGVGYCVFDILFLLIYRCTYNQFAQAITQLTLLDQDQDSKRRTTANSPNSGLTVDALSLQ